MTNRETIQLMELLDGAGIPGRDPVEQVRNLLLDLERLEKAIETEQRKPTRERLLEQLDLDPTDVLRLLADDALDRGADMEARGWRWLAISKKWPVRHPNGNWRWHWMTAGIPGHSHEIPLELWQLPVLSQPTFESPRAALLIVVDAICRRQMEAFDYQRQPGGLNHDAVRHSCRRRRTPSRHRR